MGDVGHLKPKWNESAERSEDLSLVKGFYDAAAKDKTRISLSQRNQSRIYYLRNLNNWIKSVLIARYIDRVSNEKRGDEVNILDLCCGKGGDLKKWQMGSVDHVTFVDISSASIDICKERYDSLKPNRFRGRLFSADFIVHDCTTPLYLERQYGIVSCQFALHYAFVNFEKVCFFLSLPYS